LGGEVGGSFTGGDRARQPELDLECDEFLLGAVVQVAFQRVPGAVLGGEHPLPRRAQLGEAVGEA